MTYLNTNSVHNLLNVIVTVLSALAMFDFTSIGLTPQRALFVIAVIGMAKLIINAVRDGITGMVAQQPPVVK